MQSELSIPYLIGQASFLVQFLMACLGVMVLCVLFITGKKLVQFSRYRRKIKRLQEEFWRSKDLQKLYEYYLERDAESIESLFVAGFREFKNFRPGHGELDIVAHNCRRAMEAAYARVCAEQEKGLSVLASIASSAPYIGLLGTVYGIMNSFIALGGSGQQTNIASVAPGIAEALIATAIGLIAAIPAVLLYNVFISYSERFAIEYETFIDEFSNLLQRQLGTYRPKQPKP